MVLVLIGLACNFAVIAVNGGMPVSADALRNSGQEEILELLGAEGSDKHHLLTDEDELTFLADVIVVRPPISQAISVGDLFIYGGLVWLVVAAMRAPFRRSAGSAERKPRRGKHRRGHRRSRRLPLILGSVRLEPRGREANRDRRPLAPRTRDFERSTPDRRPLPHHRHAVVAFGPRGAHVEPDAIVAEHHLDLVAFLMQRDPDVVRRACFSAFITPSRALWYRRNAIGAGTSTRRAGVEPNRGVAPHLGEETPDRLTETRTPER